MNPSQRFRFHAGYVACAILSATGLAVLGALARSDPARAFRLVVEDGPLEWLQVLFLGAAATLLFGAARHRHGRQRRLLACAAAGVLFVAGEELSWGQRQVGFESPAGLAAINRQAELNLHNLEWLHELRHPAVVFVAAAGFLWCAALCFRRRQPEPGSAFAFFQPHPLFGFQIATILVPYVAALLGVPAAWMNAAALHPHADWRLASEAGELLLYFTVSLYALTLFARARSTPIAAPASR